MNKNYFINICNTVLLDSIFYVYILFNIIKNFINNYIKIGNAFKNSS